MVDEENDHLIFMIVTTALVDDDHGHNEIITKYLQHKYNEKEARTITESIRDVLRSRDVKLASFLVDSHDIFAMRLFACLTIKLYEAIRDNGAPKEALFAINGLWKKIAEETDFVLRVRNIHL